MEASSSSAPSEMGFKEYNELVASLGAAAAARSLPPLRVATAAGAIQEAQIEFLSASREIRAPPPKPSTTVGEWEERTTLVRAIATGMRQWEDSSDWFCLRHSRKYGDAENVDVPWELFQKHQHFMRDFLKARNWHIEDVTSTTFKLVYREPHPDLKELEKW